MEKLRDQVCFDPKDFRVYLAGRLGRPMSQIRVPADVLFTFDRRIFSAATSEPTAAPANWYIYPGRMYTRKAGRRDVGVVHALIGASAAAMNLEELIAYGARRIYEVGVSGAIDTKLRPGDVVVLNGALSDEGTSKHYFRRTTRFGPSPRLTRRLEAALRSNKIGYVTGTAWTVDAPYRETKKKVARYLKRGVSVVNMESSAIFAVAAYRGVEVASVQIVSDVVSEKWEPAFHTEVVNSRRVQVLDAVLRAMSGGPAEELHRTPAA